MQTIFLRVCALLPLLFLALWGSHSIAEAGSSVKIYDEGQDWAVIYDGRDRICTIYISHAGGNFYLGQDPAVNKKSYAIMFTESNFSPTRDYYELEIDNENGELMSTSARGSQNDNGGSLVMRGLNGKVLNAIAKSRSLFLKADGSDFGQYDLRGAGRGFSRLFDCMKVGTRKAPAAPSPRTRRMN